MEFHPILEPGTNPKPDIWYVLSAAGDSPSRRIGHTCTQVRSHSSNGKLYFIGGANPDGAFAEINVLDLDTHVWDTIESSGLRARYEHTSYVPSSRPEEIFIFGGADQFGSFNDIQVFNTVDKTCTSVVCRGTPPSPRTYHNGACINEKLFVYSGGENGTNPVGDRQVYVFDASSSTWSTLSVSGDPPKPRLGHVIVAVGNKVFVHGGMSGTTFYADLHVLDLSKNTWTAVKQKKNQPSARTGHGAFVSGSDIYIFGGMSRQGALDDMYKLDTASLNWTKMATEGAPPSNRLDFATCVLRFRIQQPTLAITETERELDKGDEKKNGNQDKQVTSDYKSKTSASCTSASLPEAASETEESKLSHCLAKCSIEAGDFKDQLSTSSSIVLGLIHGGTDTEGEIFEDSLVIVL